MILPIVVASLLSQISAKDDKGGPTNGLISDVVGDAIVIGPSHFVNVIEVAVEDAQPSETTVLIFIHALRVMEENKGHWVYFVSLVFIKSRSDQEMEAVYEKR